VNITTDNRNRYNIYNEYNAYNHNHGITVLRSYELIPQRRIDRTQGIFGTKMVVKVGDCGVGLPGETRIFWKTTKATCWKLPEGMN
jgi:hypothetical protein